MGLGWEVLPFIWQPLTVRVHEPKRCRTPPVVLLRTTNMKLETRFVADPSRAAAGLRQSQSQGHSAARVSNPSHPQSLAPDPAAPTTASSRTMRQTGLARNMPSWSDSACGFCPSAVGSAPTHDTLQDRSSPLPCCAASSASFCAPWLRGPHSLPPLLRLQLTGEQHNVVVSRIYERIVVSDELRYLLGLGTLCVAGPCRACHQRPDRCCEQPKAFARAMAWVGQPLVHWGTHALAS